MTPEHAGRVGRVIREQREQLGLSQRRLVALAGINHATLHKLENGVLRSPQTDTLRAVATALQLSVTDLFAVAGWLPANELPTLRPYLRAKYRDLDEQAIADLERYADELSQRYGITGPREREDETLD
jgi:transcriptional regulator with XRE-family HTH domain